VNFQTATPAEIDTAWAAINGRIAVASADAARLTALIERYEKSYYYTDRIPALRTELDQAEAAEWAAIAETVPFRAEWERRGGWTRYFLVDNTGGHVHPDTNCSTCFPTTEYAFLPEQSGLTAAELVEMAGEKACTVCFPWAPVDTLRRSTKLEAPARKAAREAREAKAAAAAAKKAKNAIPATRIVTQGSWKETLETISAARTRLTDHYQYTVEFGWDEFITAGLDDLVQVVATKESKTTEQVITEARTRAAKRK
jgi:hypothetical protein